MAKEVNAATSVQESVQCQGEGTTLISDTMRAGGRAIELLRSYLTIYDSYHNQKEAITIAFTVFYLGGASAMIATDKPFWDRYTPGSRLAFVGIIVLAFALSWAFVLRQLQLRRAAGDIYRACNIVLSRWTVTLPTADKLKPTEFIKNVPLMKGFSWPSELVTELETIRNNSKRFWGPRDLTFIAMLVWTVGVLWRVIGVWLMPK